MNEQIIKKSRFITHINRAENKQQAVDFINTIKSQYPDARHHCWAYVAGHPIHTTKIAFSDDGEPQGTAGKPILNVLQHRQIGEVVLVVARYFGGIKLGAGGLVRAYSSSAHLALEALETKLFIATKELNIQFDYALESKVQNFLSANRILITTSSYTEHITLQLEVAQHDIQETKSQLINITSNRLIIKE